MIAEVIRNEIRKNLNESLLAKKTPVLSESVMEVVEESFGGNVALFESSFANLARIFRRTRDDVVRDLGIYYYTNGKAAWVFAQKGARFEGARFSDKDGGQPITRVFNDKYEMMSWMETIQREEGYKKITREDALDKSIKKLYRSISKGLSTLGSASLIGSGLWIMVSSAFNLDNMGYAAIPAVGGMFSVASAYYAASAGKEADEPPTKW